MKSLSNTVAELKKSVAYKKACIRIESKRIEGTGSFNDDYLTSLLS